MRKNKLAEIIDSSFDESIAVYSDTKKSCAKLVERAAQVIAKTFKHGGRLFLAGNGGSAADAQHIAAEFEGRFEKEREPLPAFAISTNSSSLTAIANDYSYEEVFSRIVRASMRRGDVFIAISTSGTSKNIIAACREARARGVFVVGLTGASGGSMKSHCDICICVPSTRTARIQEVHICIGHIICEIVDHILSGK